jgi:hypothetical protein
MELEGFLEQCISAGSSFYSTWLFYLFSEFYSTVKQLIVILIISGDTSLTEYEMERVMEALETRCYDGMQEAMKSVGLVGIEYDEDVVCDICRSVS